ncbi:MAG TPA: hypothetical protein DCP97_02995 [Ruminococcaceae bacterium]|nr:hypothetical protein [Oscillospiraceae bacterium]
MIALKKESVMNFENAVRGARNPLNSWEKSDSHYDINNNFILGQNDLSLLSRLCAAGSDHRKFMRQIFVSIDITAPIYWWKEFDTYKVGTVANSTSTMHRIHSKPFEIDDFSYDKMNDEALKTLNIIIKQLEDLRLKYLDTKDKTYWYSIIQLLPSSYNQLRTCTLNYENLRNIYFSRKNHKLDEWHTFCDWIDTLPYSKQLITVE